MSVISEFLKKKRNKELLKNISINLMTKWDDIQTAAANVRADLRKVQADVKKKDNVSLLIDAMGLVNNVSHLLVLLGLSAL
jgi:hypothetical protein